MLSTRSVGLGGSILSASGDESPGALLGLFDTTFTGVLG